MRLARGRNTNIGNGGAELMKFWLVSFVRSPAGPLYNNTKPPNLNGLYTPRDDSADPNGGWARYILAGHFNLFDLEARSPVKQPPSDAHGAAARGAGRARAWPGAPATEMEGLS